MFTEEIKKLAEEYTEEMIAFRRERHRRPEVGFEEVETAAAIARELHKLDGMEVYEGLGNGTGVMGILRGEAGEGKTILLRADIDALPTQEESGVPFASEIPGKMHACGHDCHTAWLLGSAMILSKLKDKFAGCVKFVFEPAEEKGGVAHLFIEQDHIMENPKVDAAFACHAWPDIPLGEMQIAEEIPFGYPGGFTITVTGKSGHGSWPSQAIDPIAISYQIYGALQQIISRRLLETSARTLSVCHVESGPSVVGNIIPEYCEMKGTIRANKKELMDEMIQLIKKVSAGIAEANDAKCKVECWCGDAVVNSPEAIPFFLEAAGKIVGNEKARIDRAPHLGGENFHRYLKQCPGGYVFAGIKPEEGTVYSLHSNKFLVDESVIPQVGAVFAQMAVDFFEKGELR